MFNMKSFKILLIKDLKISLLSSGIIIFLVSFISVIIIRNYTILFLISLFYGFIIALISPVRLLRSEIRHGGHLCVKLLPVSSGSIYISRIIASYMPILVLSFIPSMYFAFTKKDSILLLFREDGISLDFNVFYLVVLFTSMALLLSTLLINGLYYFNRGQYKFAVNLVGIPIFLFSILFEKYSKFLLNSMQTEYIQMLIMSIIISIVFVCIAGYYWFITRNVYRFFKR